MKSDSNVIPDRTLEAVARGFFNEASLYGFRQTDYVRFVNHLLDITITMNTNKIDFLSIFDALPHTGKKPEIPNLPDAAQLPIVGKKVTIRAINLDQDIKLMGQWFKEDSGRHFLLSCSEPVIPDYEELLSKPQNSFGIVSLNNGHSIGIVAYLNHNTSHRRAELRKLISDPCMRGKGLGKEAAKLWLKYGKVGLGLKKIFLTTLDTNTRNIRLNEALGFKVEGILRNEIFFNGRYHDILRMGLWIDDHNSSSSLSGE
jgi:RimJ/RimL family protein N-acetyltransferase